MAKRSLGKLSKRSRLLRKKTRQKTTIRAMIKEFKEGDRVSIDPNICYPGMPHPRYRGLSGVVRSKRGNAYLVEVKAGHSTKTLIIPPAHLR